MPVIKARLVIFSLVPVKAIVGNLPKILSILSADNPRAVILQSNLDKAFLPERLDHLCLNVIRRHEEQETAAARAAEFAAISAETHRFVVSRVNLRQRHISRESPLCLPTFADKLPKIAKHGFWIPSFQQRKSFVTKLDQMGKILVIFFCLGVFQLLLDGGRGMALNAGVDEAEGSIERVAALRRHLRGPDRQIILMELIQVEAAEGSVDLILNAYVFLQEISFRTDRALKEIEFRA